MRLPLLMPCLPHLVDLDLPHELRVWVVEHDGLGQQLVEQGHLLIRLLGTHTTQTPYATSTSA